MSETQYYLVEYWTGTTWTNITPYVKEISQCKFQGTGAISVASLVLSAKDGQFITNKRSGATPIIEQFNRIRISFSDDQNRTKSKIFEVTSLLAQKNVASDTLLPVELQAGESALQAMKVTAYYLFKTPSEIVEDLRIRYNERKGPTQPTLISLVGTHNLLPTTIRLVADFSQGTTYYEAIMHVINRCGSPVSAGGFGEYFALTFEDTGTPASDEGFALNMNIKVQGAGTAIEVQNTNTVRVHEVNARKEAITGSLVLVAGKPETGHSPVEFHRFISRREIWHRIPFYNTTATYKKGIHVNFAGRRYEALTDVPVSTPPPSALHWEEVTARDFIGEIDYSPLTKNKLTAWRNSWSKPLGSFAVANAFDRPAIPDSNLVIRDNKFYRDYAHFRAITDDLEDDDDLKRWLHKDFMGVKEINAGLRQGLRILVDSTLGDLGGRFAENGGKDRFGNAFVDSLCTWDGNEWIVLFSRAVMEAQFAPATRQYQVAVLNEGRVYEFTAPITNQRTRPSNTFLRGPTSSQLSSLKWRDASGAIGNNDCFHHPNATALEDGLLHTQDDLGTAHYDSNSTLRIRFRHAFTQTTLGWFGSLLGPVIDAVRLVEGFLRGDPLGNPDTSADALLAAYYDIGWWASISFPFPTTGHVGQTIGSEWGGGLRRRNDFGLLDVTNANFSRKGEAGFNGPEDDELLGPFAGLHFLFRFEIKDASGNLIDWKGNIAFTVAMYDYESNVWKADFTYRVHGDTEQIYIPLSSFTVKRPSHTPYGITRLFTSIVTPLQQVGNIFEERRIQMITMQLKGSYEGEGERYAPSLLWNFVDAVATIPEGGEVILDGYIDGLTFVKQPLGTSGQVTKGNVVIPRIVQQPQIRNLEQLDNVAAAEKDVHNHQYENYEVLAKYRNDLSEEGPILLKDEDIIDSAGRKLVVKYLNYSFSTAGSRPGPLLSISATRRLNPP